MLAEGEFVAAADLHLARVGQHGHAANGLADFAGAVADVAPHAAADGAANADERFQPAEPCRTANAIRSKSCPPPPARDALAVHES